MSPGDCYLFSLEFGRIKGEGFRRNEPFEGILAFIMTIKSNQNQYSSRFNKMCEFCTPVLCTSKPVQYHCGQCDWTSRNRQSSMRHCRTEHGGEVFKCDLCPAKIRWSMANLQNHKDRVHGAAWSNPISCGQCDYVGNTEKIVRNHEDAVHRRKWKKSLQCNECDNKFTSKYSLDEHVKYLHVMQRRPSRAQIWPCPQCPKVFTRKYSQLQHEQKKHQ